MSNNKKVTKSREKERARKIKQQKQIKKNQIKKQKVAKKRFRIKYKKVLAVIVTIILIIFIGKSIYDIPIKNIIIKGNYYLTDQEIIEIMNVRDYPSSLANSSYALEQRLTENDFIETATVTKKRILTKLIVTIDENMPLFYYQPANKTILEDGTMVNDKYNVPIVINQVPDTVYEKLIKKMKDVPLSVLDKMSEIKYVPTDVDSELFLITMNDGNYVYVTLSKFERIYNYIEYAEGFDHKKGILHLDSGDYLEIIEK